MKQAYMSFIKKKKRPSRWVQEVDGGKGKGKGKGRKRNIYLAFEFKLQEMKEGK
jgi:hypothetical protein